MAEFYCSYLKQCTFCFMRVTKTAQFKMIQLSQLKACVVNVTLTRAGVCKTLCPQHLLPLIWPNMHSAVIPQENLDFAQKLLIIPYQLTKFPTPSSNLTRLKCPLQRAITQEKLDRICPKVNQVICSSYPIS